MSDDDLGQARAQEYALLSALLARSPDAALLGRIAQIRGDVTPLGIAHAALAEEADRLSAEAVAREYFSLFVGLGRGELLPYASYYLTGFLHGRPLARLRQSLQAIGVARADGQSEPEDHAATLFEVMAGLAGGTLVASAGAERVMFETHLAPWISRFFTDLEQAKGTPFYNRVGALGRVFVAIEAEAFTLPD